MTTNLIRKTLNNNLIWHPVGYFKNEKFILKSAYTLINKKIVTVSFTKHNLQINKIPIKISKVKFNDLCEIIRLRLTKLIYVH